MVTKRFVACLAVAGAILCGLPVSGHVAEEPFPEYTVVKPNVSFWISIYTRYATTQAVVHDNVDLDVVYDVVDLEPADSPGASKINRRRMKAASQKYTQILQRLAADPSTQDPDCRRVTALFETGADANVFQRASHQVRCQIGQRDRFQGGLVRSGAHIDQIRAIMTSYGVPEDLAYLPHVESSFDGNAYSKFGAAGMWQFIRSTGKRFLTVDTILDERRDPIAATHAAAQLLKENHEKLGSWPLAITAYNHGAAGMERAKAAHGDYPRIFTAYNGRTFKFASRNFYSEFLAARKIASDYQRYFGDMELAEPISYSSMRLEGFVAFTELCHRLGFDPEIVRSMNPALRPTVFNGQKFIPQHYRLNLPSTAEFNSGVSLASLLSDIYQRAQKPSHFYMVQRGDTAGKIARMHHVKLEDLMMANNLTPRATIYVRQRLRIPQPGAPIPPQEDVSPEDTVRSEVVLAIADTPPEEDLNNIPFGKPLQLHQAVQIPLESVVADAFEARRLSFHRQPQKDFFAAYRVGELQQYLVKPGDSYWTLCREKFDLPLRLLQYYNKDVNLAVLGTDQPLTIPAIETIPEERSVGVRLAATPDV